MTVEEALIAFLAAVAGILLFVGLAQALDAGMPRRGSQRARAASEPAPVHRLASGGLEGLRVSTPGSRWPADQCLEESSPMAARTTAPPPSAPPSSEEPTPPEPRPPDHPHEAAPVERPVEHVLFEDSVELIPFERSPDTGRREETPRHETPPPHEPPARDEPPPPHEPRSMEEGVPIPAPSTAELPPPAPPPTARERPPTGESQPTRQSPRVLVDAPASGEPSTASVEIGARLFLTGQFEDALTVAEAGLGELEGARAGEAAHAKTGLGSLVALSRTALADDRGAEAAFAAALADIPEVVGAACPPALATMAMPIARRLIEWGERFPEGAKECIVGPRLAAFWLRWRLIAAPGDGGAEALLDAARSAIAESHAGTASALIGHQQWREASRVIEQARAAGELPEMRAELLNEVLAASLRREVERLTAPIIRGAKNESRALGALQRAEATIASVQDLQLPARQRIAMARRIWRAYARLGMARLQAGSLDAATDSLLHALGMREIGRRRQRQVRDAVVKALETAGDEKVDHIVKLLAEGDRPTAVERVEAFAALVQQARDRGVPERELAVASTKARLLAQLIEPTI